MRKKNKNDLARSSDVKRKWEKKPADPQKKLLRRRKILTAVKNFFLVIFGTLILAFGTAVFVIPFDLVVGGVSSIAIILNRILGIEALSVDVLITAVTWILFFVGLIFLSL